MIKKIESYGYSPVSAEKIYDTGNSFINKHYKDYGILDKPLGRIRKIQSIENPNTKRNVVKALMIFKKALNKPDQEAAVKYYKKIFGRAMDARETDERKPVDTSGFDTKRDEIESDFDSLVEKNDQMMILNKLPTMIMLRIISDLPTRRANDYRTLLLKKPREGANKANYYSKGKLFFNDFKGKEAGSVSLSGDQPITKFFKRTKEGVVIDVPKEVQSYINLLRKIDRQRNYLIERGDRQPYSASMFSKYILKTFNMTVNDFRKRWVQKNVDSKAIDKAKETAKQMSNSVATQQRDYVARD